MRAESRSIVIARSRPCSVTNAQRPSGDMRRSARDERVEQPPGGEGHLIYGTTERRLVHSPETPRATGARPELSSAMRASHRPLPFPSSIRGATSWA